MTISDFSYILFDVVALYLLWRIYSAVKEESDKRIKAINRVCAKTEKLFDRAEVYFADEQNRDRFVALSVSAIVLATLSFFFSPKKEIR